MFDTHLVIVVHRFFLAPNHGQYCKAVSKKTLLNLTYEFDSNLLIVQ
jgi:hypothetical protein